MHIKKNTTVSEHCFRDISTTNITLWYWAPQLVVIWQDSTWAYPWTWTGLGQCCTSDCVAAHPKEKKKGNRHNLLGKPPAPMPACHLWWLQTTTVEPCSRQTLTTLACQYFYTMYITGDVIFKEKASSILHLPSSNKWARSCVFAKTV